MVLARFTICAEFGLKEKEIEGAYVGAKSPSGGPGPEARNKKGLGTTDPIDCRLSLRATAIGFGRENLIPTVG